MLSLIAPSDLLAGYGCICYLCVGVYEQFHAIIAFSMTAGYNRSAFSTFCKKCGHLQTSAWDLNPCPARHLLLTARPASSYKFSYLEVYQAEFLCQPCGRTDAGAPL